MNWITKLVGKRDKSKNLVRDIPENLWINCPTCKSILFKEDLQKNNYICSSCDYYFYMPIMQRVQSIFSGEEYKEIPISGDLVKDPIKFKGKEKYEDKLNQYQKQTGFKDAALVTYGKVGNKYVTCFLLNFQFMGGSMGSYVGEAFVQAVNNSIKWNAPLIAVTASGGARMQEGLISLMQMAKTTVALNRLKEKKIPYIVILTNPTTGGVTASFAMLGDIHIAEKSATIGFAGKRVIEKTIRKQLPTEFQTAEYLLEHGMIDLISSRQELPSLLKRLVSYF